MKKQKIQEKSDEENDEEKDKKKQGFGKDLEQVQYERSLL